LTVERWNGTAFEPLGAPFQALNESIVSPVMVADASGNPILAWLDGLNSSRQGGRRPRKSRAGLG
jgi:hypothetical protein